ncbi:hypothetical protein VULLAG_LOCUS5141 [Vulpes lagopus]
MSPSRNFKYISVILNVEQKVFGGGKSHVLNLGNSVLIECQDKSVKYFIPLFTSKMWFHSSLTSMLFHLPASLTRKLQMDRLCVLLPGFWPPFHQIPEVSSHSKFSRLECH